MFLISELFIVFFNIAWVLLRKDSYVAFSFLLFLMQVICSKVDKYDKYLGVC